jgi:hypothetical protein
VSFSKEQPWYYSLHKKTEGNDDNQTLFFQVLGLTNKAEISLCNAVGHMTIRIMNGYAVMHIELEQWRNFIRGSGLSGATQLNKRDLVFINLGSNNIQPKELYFTPHQQYKKAPP